MTPAPSPCPVQLLAVWLLLQITGQRENLLSVPVALMDGIIGILDFFAKFFPAQFEVCGLGWVLCMTQHD